MPYIKREDRKANNPLITVVAWCEKLQRDTSVHIPIRIATPGELNFAMTTLANEYVRRRGVNYTVLNEVVGVFSSAMAEFQRRVVAPYEDIKRAKNGEVYDCLDPLLIHIPQETDDVKPDQKT